MGALGVRRDRDNYSISNLNDGMEVRAMSKVSVRYIVNDVDSVIPFYTDMLGFKVDMHPAPGFARLSRGNLPLLLTRPGAAGAAQAPPPRPRPRPGRCPRS